MRRIVLIISAAAPAAAALATGRFAAPLSHSQPSYASPLRRSALLLAPTPAIRRTGRPPIAMAADAAGAPGEAAAATPVPLPKGSPAVEKLRNRLWSWGWISWWCQTILTVIAGVILLFANSVLQQSFTTAPVLVGRALALLALASAAVSNFWTWSFTRISARFGRRNPSPADASSLAAGALSIGVFINLFGMAVAIVGAEAIVGTLAAKTLTQGAGIALATSGAPVQAIDMLVVQANTNTLASHFCSLCATMRMQKAATACAE